MKIEKKLRFAEKYKWFRPILTWLTQLGILLSALHWLGAEGESKHEPFIVSFIALCAIIELAISYLDKKIERFIQHHYDFNREE